MLSSSSLVVTNLLLDNGRLIDLSSFSSPSLLEHLPPHDPVLLLLDPFLSGSFNFSSSASKTDFSVNVREADSTLAGVCALPSADTRSSLQGLPIPRSPALDELSIASPELRVLARALFSLNLLASPDWSSMFA